MEFQRIDPGVRGFENHVYECGRCYTMKTASVQLPMAPMRALRGAK
jgi:hypothetical protein